MIGPRLPPSVSLLVRILICLLPARIAFKGPVVEFPFRSICRGNPWAVQVGLKGEGLSRTEPPFLRRSRWDSSGAGIHGSRFTDPAQESSSAEDKVLFPEILSHKTGWRWDFAILGWCSTLHPERRAYLQVPELHTNILEVHRLFFCFSSQPAPAHSQNLQVKHHWVTTMGVGRILGSSYSWPAPLELWLGADANYRASGGHC